MDVTAALVAELLLAGPPQAQAREAAAGEPDAVVLPGEPLHAERLGVEAREPFGIAGLERQLADAVGDRRVVHLPPGGSQGYEFEKRVFRVRARRTRQSLFRLPRALRCSARLTRPASGNGERVRLSRTVGGEGFKERSEHELAAMPEDRLIVYLLAAREAGAETGLPVSILVYKLMRDVRRRVSMKVPAEAVEEVSEAVLLSALTSRFDGASVGEFRSWLSTIIKRRIADHHRSPKTDVRLVPLPDEHEGDDDVWGSRAAVPFEGDAIDVERALKQALGELNPEHREVVRLYVFEDLPAAEVAQRVDGISETNVHKIAQRFRDRVAELLPDGDDTST